jgi:hypothetical protein
MQELYAFDATDYNALQPVVLADHQVRTSGTLDQAIGILGPLFVEFWTEHVKFFLWSHLRRTCFSAFQFFASRLLVSPQ